MEAFLKKHVDTENEIDRTGQYKVSFGKYRGQTFAELYNNDKKYVAFILSKFDKIRNQKLFDYLEYRIEEDATKNQVFSD